MESKKKATTKNVSQLEIELILKYFFGGYLLLSPCYREDPLLWVLPMEHYWQVLSNMEKTDIFVK